MCPKVTITIQPKTNNWTNYLIEYEYIQCKQKFQFSTLAGPKNRSFSIFLNSFSSAAEKTSGGCIVAFDDVGWHTQDQMSRAHIRIRSDRYYSDEYHNYSYLAHYSDPKRMRNESSVQP